MAEEDGSTEWKTRHVYCFGKINVLRLDLNECFLLRGTGRSFHAEAPKTEKVPEPKVCYDPERLRMSEAEQSTG